MSRHPAPTGEKTFFGHPFQLSTLFHIELWERFSFYGMQGILLIYLYYTADKGGLGIDKTLAGGIVGAYSGSVYLSTILGAWFADRVWGAEKTLFLSGIVVMLGHIVLAAAPGLYGLLIGLIFIALGSGGVKSTASSMVGALYEQDEMRPLRDAGFSIFYIAINIGGFLGPLLTGLLQENIGFHYGFGAAAVGMAFGLWRYSLGRKNLPHPTVPHPLSKGQGKTAAAVGIALIAALATAIKTGLVNLDNFLRHPIIYRHPCRHRLFRPPADQPPRQFRQQTAHHRLHPAFPDHLYVLGRLVSDLHRGNRLFRRNRQPHHRFVYRARRLERFYAKPVGHPVFRTDGGNVDKNGAQTAQNPAEIRYGGICYRRVVFGIRPLYFLRYADAYCGFRTDRPRHHDRRTDDFPDCAVHLHQNRTAFIQNPNGRP